MQNLPSGSDIQSHEAFSSRIEQFTVIQSQTYKHQFSHKIQLFQQTDKGTIFRSTAHPYTQKRDTPTGCLYVFRVEQGGTAQATLNLPLGYYRTDESH